MRWVSKRIVLGIFPIAFAVGMIDGVLPYLHLYILSIINNATAYDLGVYTTYMNIGKIILNPILLFTVSYLVGRGIDVGSNLRSTVLSSFLGCFVGEYIGTLCGTGFMFVLLNQYERNYFLYTAIPQIFTSAFYSVSMFFVSFSGIAITNFRKNKTKTNELRAE